MKKLMPFLLVAALAITIPAGALLIPPAAPEHILPTAGSGVIFIPKNVSAYSYENVSFDMLGTGTLFQPQHLEVYAWETDNFTNAGIRWVRRDASWNVIDDGYITTGTLRMSHEVGILQDDDGNTFVLAVWNGIDPMSNTGTFYQTYLWTPTGLVPYTTPLDLVVGLVGPATPPSGRASLDCYGLKKAAVTFYEASPTGYISACVLTMGATLTVSNTIYIAGTAGSGRQADVSLGNNGNTVRVAWVDAPSPLTPPHDIYVASVNYTTIATAADGAIVPFNPESFLSAATSELASHLHIDCPDNYGSDIWSLAYMYDPTMVMSHTKRPSGTLVSTILSAPGYAGYTNPVVSYGQGGNIIVYGWYSSGQNTYIATQLSNNGTTFIAPTTSGTFYNIPLSVPFSSPNPTNLTWLDFSKNSNNTRLSMGYMVTDGGSPPYFDLRSKNVSWIPAAMRGEGNLPNSELISVSAFPNPFTHSISISANPYQGEKMDARMVDITGKVLLEMQGQDLNSVNQQLKSVSDGLPSANYFINVAINEMHSMHKIVKL